jgi:spore germination protein YaaH
VEWLLPSIHSWKILLKVPVYALQWEFGLEDVENGGSPNRLPYQAALSRAFRHGARLSQDEGGFPYYSYKQKGTTYHIRLPHHGLIADASAVANRHNLAGLILDELGMEDPRIWQSLTSHFRLASLNISEE